MIRFCCYTLLSLLLAAGYTAAEIIYIPTDYSTIQAGIDASADGDTVIVADGTYFENIDFGDKAITLSSEMLLDGDPGHVAATEINGGQSSSVITINDANPGFKLISGLTFKDGFSTYGGGIQAHCDNLKLSDNIVIQNSSDGFGGGLFFTGDNIIITNNSFYYNEATSDNGGGIYCYGSRALISDNLIHGNSSASQGGGLYCLSSEIELLDNEIRENVSFNLGGSVQCVLSDIRMVGNYFHGNISFYRGGAIVFFQSYPYIVQNIFENNSTGSWGGAIYCARSYPLFLNNVFYGNESQYGGAIYFWGSEADLKNSIFWINNASYGDQFYLNDSEIEVSYCLVQGGWQGTGNINTDPRFRDAGDSDFHLMATECDDQLDSPCIDSGDPWLHDGLIDCDWGLGDLTSDMGAFGGSDTTQTGIESNPNSLPSRTILTSNYPNPFNSSTMISYNLPTASRVRLDIYDILGRKVENLFEGMQQAGEHSIIWHADKFSSGVYFFKMTAGNKTETKKMLLVK